MRLIDSLSIGVKIWGLVALISGLAVFAVVGGWLLARDVERVGLDAVRDSMMSGHESKLRALVQSQTAGLASDFASLESEEEKLALMRERFKNSWFYMTRDETEKTGYFFAYALDGTNVAHGASPNKHGKPHWDSQDPNGKYTYREFAEQARKGGGFVEYVQKKPGTEEMIPKLSYVELIPGTDWYVGTGVYIDDIEAKMASIRAKVGSDMASNALRAGLFLGGYALLIVAPATVYLIRKAIVGPIRETAEVMRDIAEGEGDLTKRIEVKSSDEVGQLAERFNAFAEKVHDLVVEVVGATHEVASAATEIAASSEEMARGMSDQQEQVVQISAAVEEMSASIVEVAHKSSDAAEQAEESGQVAEEGNGIVTETVETMGAIREAVMTSSAIVDELGRRSDEIGQIIAVINDIADQTNLLALNAAIEAARAGEHGRGFAVVADEVRKLADRTTEATGEVAKTIRAIQEETKRAVAQMDEGGTRVQSGVERAGIAGEALQKITSRTREVASMIASIAAAAEQQSTAGAQISRGIESISAVTAQATAGASQAASAAEALSGKAEELRRLVGQFKVSEVGGRR
ncbi:MAG: HAMP domain-containing protein [Planctomycetota bacterium]|nr:MAG: HAMP domain-containing protein [Planctomycetota bacterium]